MKKIIYYFSGTGNNVAVAKDRTRYHHPDITVKDMI